MCYGENNAAHVIDYCNDQLRSLWSIASQCWEHHVEDHGLGKPEVLQHRHSLSPAVYHIGRRTKSHEDLMFYARFDHPKLIARCRHEMLFEVSILEGHYNTDHGSGADVKTANHTRNQPITSNYTFTYRVPYRVEEIGVNVTSIGNGDHKIQLLVLDYRNAKLIHRSIRPEREGEAYPSAPPVQGQQSFEFYLEQYLNFLQAAGHHVLFSLPNFEDGKAEAPAIIDYSWIADDEQLKLITLDEIHGITIQDIGNYLRTAWLKAAMCVPQRGEKVTDRSATSFAEYHGTWRDSQQDKEYTYHLQFGVPEIIPWCNDEIIMTFIIDEVQLVPADGGQSFVFTEWRIAVMMNIVYSRPAEEDGNLTVCYVDISSAHWLEDFSEFVGLHEAEESVLTWSSHIATFMSGDYLNILESANYHYIYRHDRRLVSTFDEIDVESTAGGGSGAAWFAGGVGEERRMTRTSAWRRIIQESDMYGFDQITALSETAISRYLASIMTTWKFEDKFQVDFKAPVFRLYGDGTAVLMLNLKTIELRPATDYESDATAESLNYEDWRIAFRVHIRMVTDAELGLERPAWDERFRDSPSLDQLNQLFAGEESTDIFNHLDFRHIIIDCEKCIFLSEFSNFNELFTSKAKRPIRKVHDTVAYLRDEYLPQLSREGKHILFSVPLWKISSQTYHYHLTSIIFEISSRHTSTQATQTTQSSSSQPVILILGVRGGRAIPSRPSGAFTEWIARAERYFSCGTVSISSAVFLNEKLLRSLSQVNALTTIITNFKAQGDSNDWNFEVKTWNESGDGDKCRFGPVQGSQGDYLEYLWERSDRWNYTYKHHGEGRTTSGNFIVNSRTENHLEIPTAYTFLGTMSIKVYGTVTLELSSVDADRSWKSSAQSTWQATLQVSTEEGGRMKIANDSPLLVTTMTDDKGEDSAGLSPTYNPSHYLESVMPKKIVLDEAGDDFKDFVGPWKSCFSPTTSYLLTQPVFNRCGDILFELQPPASEVAPAVDGGTSDRPSAPASKMSRLLKRQLTRKSANGTNGGLNGIH